MRGLGPGKQESRAGPALQGLPDKQRSPGGRSTAMWVSVLQQQKHKCRHRGSSELVPGHRVTRQGQAGQGGRAHASQGAAAECEAGGHMRGSGPGPQAERQRVPREGSSGSGQSRRCGRLPASEDRNNGTFRGFDEDTVPTINSQPLSTLKQPSQRW